MTTPPKNAIRFGSVTLDCPDPSALANFYATLLGVEVAYDAGDFAALKLDCAWLSFQRAEEFCAPTWPDPSIPQQFHLDFSVDDLDICESVALAAGAAKASMQPSPERWRVMFDPAGHPFCLSNQIPE